MAYAPTSKAVSSPIGSGREGRYSAPRRFLPLSQFFLQRKPEQDKKALYGLQEPEKKKGSRGARKSPAAPDAPEAAQEEAILDESAAHAKSIALMRWLSKAAKELRVDRHVYVVGGAVRNFVIDQPIKDVDVVFDAVALGRGRDSAWFARQLQKKMPAKSNLTTNQYGVAIITVKGDWELEGHNLKGEVIEIANARAESYGGTGGKGYKPSDIRPAPIEKDIKRREFTFNTLMWRLADLAKGPDKAEIIDITGCGIADLKAGTMRCPMDPDKTFGDDPTRMLRAIKFMVKYGFKISPDTEASIRRNADKIRNAPSSAISKLLIDPILKEPKTAPKALREMKRLGLLDVVAKMIRTDPQFASTLSNWANDQRVSLLFDLMDMGLPLKTKLGAFTREQQGRIREVTATMPDAKARDFLAALKQPGKAWKDKLFFPALAAEAGVDKTGMGDFSRRVNAAAQNAMLDDPELASDPTKLKVAIKQRLSVREAKSSAPKPSNWDEHHKCAFCDAPGTNEIAWDNGKAIIMVCDKHIEKAKAEVAKRDGVMNSVPEKDEGVTTTVNVPTVPVPIGAGDGRRFLDRPGDKKKRKKKDLPARMGLLLRRLF